MKFIIGLLGICLLASIVLKERVPTKPELRRIKGSASYVAHNPLFSPIDMKIVCLGDFEPITISVLARTKETLEIKQPTGEAAACFLDSYVQK